MPSHESDVLLPSIKHDSIFRSHGIAITIPRDPAWYAAEYARLMSGPLCFRVFRAL